MLTWKNQILMAAMVVLLVSAGHLSECSAQNQPSRLNEPARHPVPAELRPSTEINRRYRAMLESNQAKQRSGQTNLNQASQQSSELYIRNTIPKNLIPPSRTNHQHGQAVQNFGTMVPRGQQHAVPGHRNDYQQPVYPQQRPVTQNRQRSVSPVQDNRPASSNSYPPRRLQRQGNIPPQVSKPIFYNRETNRPGQRKHRVMQTSQPEESRLIKGSTRIPASDDDNSKVTRARIVMIQDTGDPFGQAPGPVQGNRDDPFDDPDQNRKKLPQNQTGDPFADPPQSRVPQQGRDPFADPPEDLVPQKQDPRDPFRDPPAQMPDVDPFPENPGGISPGQFDPVDEPNVVDPIMLDPGIGEDSLEGVGAPPEAPGLPRETLGPFKSRRGFEPTPILPAPPRREFSHVLQQSIPTFDSTILSPDSVITSQDQPSFFGPAFNKTQIYDGVSKPIIESGYPQEAIAEPQRLARRKVLDRFNHLDIRQLCQNAKCLIPGCRGECASGNRVASVVQGNASGSGTGSFFNNSACVDSCFEPLFYVSVFGGYTQLEDTTASSSLGFVLANSSTVQFNDGFGVGVALGQFQGPNLRTELELTYRNNQADSLSILGLPGDIDGSAESLTGLFNVIWDFSPRPIYRNFQPYTGIGLGFTILDIDVPNNLFEVNESQSSFAFQLMAGISRPLTLRTDGFVEYRYLNADSVRLVAGSAAGSVEYETDDIFFGIRMHF